MPPSRRRIAAVAALAASTALTALVSTAPPSAAAVSPSSNLVINEVYGGGGNSGAPFNQDFIELFNKGTTPIDLSGYSLQYSSSGGSFQTSLTTTLSGTIQPGGYFLVGEGSGANGVAINPDLTDPTPILLSATAGKVALVNGTGLISNAGCTGSACGSLSDVVDFVGFGGANGWAGAGPTAAPSNTVSVSRNATHGNTGNNNTDFATSNPPTPQNGGSGTEEPPPTGGTKTIAEIQGPGASSPLVGATVTTRGVVTAAYPSGGFNGYYLQTPGTGGGTSIAGRTTSDGIFIFSSATVGSVAVGQYVEVTGVVSEFNGLTELTVGSSGLTVLSSTGIVPPAPLQITWPATEAARESIESMLIAPQGSYTVTDTFETNHFGEVTLASGTTPLMQPTDVHPVSDTAGINAVKADNAARMVTLDDGSSTNFLTATSQTLPYVSLANPLRVGAPTTFPESMIVDWRFDLWRFQPTHPVTNTTPLTQRANFADTRTPVPDAAAIGSDLRIASFNVLNYFTTLGATTPGCVAYTDRNSDPVTVREGCNPRGAWDPADFTRQQDKIVAAINALDADVVGLMEIENSQALGEATDEATASLVAALNTAAGPGTWAFVPSSAELPSPSLRDVITNALIYRTASVERLGDSRALGTQSASGQAFDNAREPIGQVFRPVGGGTPFFVAVNHLKSKGSGTGQDADTGDGQGASNFSRVRQAEALRDWVPTVLDDIPGTPVEDVYLIGDFNAYTQEDPLQVLYAAGYADVNLAKGGNAEQSYSFDSLNGSLDHVIANASGLARVTGSDIWNINSPEVIALEYSRYNYHGTLFYEPNQYRSSDHDPVIAGIVADTSPTTELTLLGINDFHGRIDANTVKFAGTVEQLRAAGGEDDTLFVSAGDNIGASLFASAVAQDQPTIDVLNALDLDASAVGNHEFDQGFDDLTDRVIPASDFPFLGANVYGSDGVTPALDEYALFERAGLTVAVIGTVTQETPSLVSPAGVAGLVFGDPVAAVNRVAAQLSDGNAANGEADVIVAEYHEGGPETESATQTLEAEMAASPVFAHIVNDTSSTVDAIFTGHTHKLYAFVAPLPGVEGKTRPIVQTGNYGENVGEITLTVDTSTNEVLAHTQRNVARTTVADSTLVSDHPRVAEVKTIVDEALAAAAIVGDQPVGSVTADITTAYSGGTYTGGVYTGGTRDDRTKESTLGDLVADSLLDALAPADRGGAQIGVANPGGLRAELLYAPDGTITFAEANAVLPFVNNLWTTTLTGAEFKTVLEQQWQRDAAGNVPSRSYLQLGLSDNVTYTYDPALPEGSRITSITVDGAPIDPAGEYRIGTFSFLVEGGDNFRGFLDGSDARDSGLIDRDAWIDYIGDSSPLAPDFARQATIVTGLPASVQAGSSLSFTVSGLDLTSLGSPANATVDVVVGGQTIGTVPVTTGTATINVTVPVDQELGGQDLEVIAHPSDTTVSLSIDVTEAPDTDGPETTITSGPANGSTIAVADATFDFESDEAGSTFTCVLDGAAPQSCASPLTLTGLTDGSHTFSVFATDTAGNPDPTPATVTFTVDRTAPETTITSGPATGSTIPPGTATFGFTSSEPNSTFQCQVDGGAIVSCTSPFTTANLAPGSHTFKVTATDAFGNLDITPDVRTFTVAAPPPPPPAPKCLVIKILFITISICI